MLFGIIYVPEIETRFGRLQFNDTNACIRISVWYFSSLSLYLSLSRIVAKQSNKAWDH